MAILRYFLYTFLFAVLSLHADITPSTLQAGGSVVPHDKEYYTFEDKNNSINIIYPEENLLFAQHTFAIEKKINKEYQKLYGWSFDEMLHLSLVSSNNQIANGFSTQWPNNRQVNYMGGALLVDYFASTSWLDTLLYHETAHNYQLNAKGAKITRTLHSIFGNGSVFIPLLPITVPNSFENSFMLEGNAVLNESWHGNGGRLYSGRFYVQTLLQAKASNITAENLYNKSLKFPYADKYYIIGGFYALYMAEKYGLDVSNKYFINYSKYWYWPFLTNKSMYDSVGISFEKSLNEFSSKYTKIATNVVLNDAKEITSSQFFYPLNSDSQEIYFLTNKTGVDRPELVKINKKTLQIQKDKQSWVVGKVIKANGKYFTQAGKYISPTKIQQGLFDKNGFIKESTSSKIIQGYTSDKTEVYFDVKSSYSQPQLYVGKNFYAQVNSSVFIDNNNNIYYFKQYNKQRTLYKNHKPLFSYKGFYGIVCDVDAQGGVYFIANSKYGSTLYKYKDRKIFRVTESDNVIDAKLISEKKALFACIAEDRYYYTIDTLTQTDAKVYEVKLFFENEKFYSEKYNNKNEKTLTLKKSKKYSAPLNMHYSKSDFTIGMVDGSVVGDVSINFADPLTQNAANMFISRDESNVTIAGIGYANAQYLLKYRLKAYGVVDDNNRKNTRNFGIIADAELPFYKSGYYYASIASSFYQDYNNLQREPLSIILNFERSEIFANSMYENYFNGIKLYQTFERDDKIYGAVYRFKHSLLYESYISFGAKFSKADTDISDIKAQSSGRGVKVTNESYQLDMDISTIYMPNIDTSKYFKDVFYTDIEIAKVFNFSSYFFTFPFSLQRESVYAKYRYYNLATFDKRKNRVNMDEITLGSTISTVIFNNLEMPLSFEYTYNNDNSGILNNKNSFRLYIGTRF